MCIRILDLPGSAGRLREENPPPYKGVFKAGEIGAPCRQGVALDGPMSGLPRTKGI